MAMTHCEACGLPAFATQANLDAGTPVYCGPECVSGHPREDDGGEGELAAQIRCGQFRCEVCGRGLIAEDLELGTGLCWKCHHE